MEIRLRKVTENSYVTSAWASDVRRGLPAPVTEWYWRLLAHDERRGNVMILAEGYSITQDMATEDAEAYAKALCPWRYGAWKRDERAAINRIKRIGVVA